MADAFAVAPRQRAAARRAIVAAALELERLAKGQAVRVPPAVFDLHPGVVERVRALQAEGGRVDVEQFEDGFAEDVQVLNALQALVAQWHAEIERIVAASRDGPAVLLPADEEQLFWVSVDSAFESAQNALAMPAASVSLQLLARKRRLAGFMSDSTDALNLGRQRAQGILNLVQSLPIGPLRTADDLPSLISAIRTLLSHVASKLRLSSFPLNRALALVSTLSQDVCNSLTRILVRNGGLLGMSYKSCLSTVSLCEDMFRTWDKGFERCRHAAVERAEARGERIEPRPPPPFTPLQTRIRDIATFRTGHQSRRTVIDALRTAAPSLAEGPAEIDETMVARLDAAYQIVADEFDASSLLDMSSEGDAKWGHVLGAYGATVYSTEELLAAHWEACVGSASTLELKASVAIHFLPIVDRDVFVERVAASMPGLVQLAREALACIRHESAQLTGSASIDSGFAAVRGIPCVSYRVMSLRQQSNALDHVLRHVRNVVGEVRMSTDLDLRDLVLECDVLRKSLNPALVVSQWVASVCRNDLDVAGSIFRPTSAHGLRLSLAENTATVPSELSTLADLGFADETRPVRDFGKRLVVVYPAYLILNEAIQAYKVGVSAAAQLRKHEPQAARRVSPLYRKTKRGVRKCFEQGAGMLWTASPDTLVAYAKKLRNAARSFSEAVLLAVNRDASIQTAVKCLRSLQPRVSIHGIVAEDVEELVELLRTVDADVDDMASCKGLADVGPWYKDRVVAPILLGAMRHLLKRVVRSWEECLQTGTLGLPNLTLMHSSEKNVFEFSSPLVQFEEVIYESLFRSIGCVCSVKSRLLAKDRVSKDGKPAASVLDSKLIESLFKFNGSHEPVVSGASKLIRGLVQRAQEQLVAWGAFEGLWKIDVDVFLQTTEDSNLPSWNSLLANVVETRQSVERLMSPLSGDGDTEVPLLIDVTPAGAAVLSQIAFFMERISEKCSQVVSEELEATYALAKESLALIRDAGALDPMDCLLLLKSMRDDILPTCTVKSKQVQDLIGTVRGISGLSLLVDMMDPASVSAEVDALTLELEQRERHANADRPALEARYNAEQGALEIELADLFGDVSQQREDSAASDDAAKVVRDLADMETRFSDAKSKCVRVRSIAKALQLPEPSNDMELDTLAVELEEIRVAMSEAAAVETELETLGKVRLGSCEPVMTRRRLDMLGERLKELQISRGGLTLAHKLENIVAERLRLHGLVASLRAAKLSAPREREVVGKLLGDSAGDSNLQGMTLAELWSCNLDRHERYLQTVFESAAGESSLASFLASVADVWTSRRVDFVARGRVKLIRGISVLLDDANEHLHALSTMSGSPHARLFEAERASWELRICKFRDEVEVWNEVQTRWLQLHALFDESSASSGPLRRELRQEFASFKSVQARFADFSSRAQSAPGILEVLEKPSGLDRMSIELAAVIRGLSKFLEKQRSLFPRFFYLSDEDLLSVLSVGHSNLSIITPHLPKLFPGVARLGIDERSDDSGVRICTVLSKEGETLDLVKPVEIGEKVHVTSWLCELESQVKDSLRVLFPVVLGLVREVIYKHAGASAPASEALSELLKCRPAQLILLAAKVVFTASTDCALSSTEGKRREKVEVLLAEIGTALANITEQPRSLVREQLIKELVFQTSVLRGLLDRCQAAADEMGAGDYQWYAQLRFYCSLNDCGAVIDVRMEMADASAVYGWEYLGVGETLVQTSLTRRCFLTLMQAMKRGLGGSPVGPAGTGKTESVKALGRLLGRSVAVFNCDETFDAVSVGRILAGVCRTGSWVCFDEFNRLSAGILSATSNQLAILQAAIQTQKPMVPNFYGGLDSIKVAQGVAVFVTMNPTYSGRRELPANLKTLFRPFAMTKPDLNVIAEVSLLAQGFRSAAVVAPALVACFQNFLSEISARPHYDFGLRSLKNAIEAAGALLRGGNGAEVASRERSEEGHYVVRALLETVKPKVVPEDIGAFETVLRRAFPAIELSLPPLPEVLLSALKIEAKSRSIFLNDALLEKVAQLHKVLQYRAGVMLVGSPGTGKSAAWQLLRHAMFRVSLLGDDESPHCEDQISTVQGTYSSTMSKLPPAHIIDPKLVSAPDLYGSLDVTTREWTDGVLTRVLRNGSFPDETKEYVGTTSGGRSNYRDNMYEWIVFDGDIDPDWAENLNSVLDDSRVLTLPTGERVPLHPRVRILFETVDVLAANPSTISRCGMVCFYDCSMAKDVAVDKPPPTLSAVALRFVEERAAQSEILRACVDSIRKLVPPTVLNISNLRQYRSPIMDVSPFGALNALFALFDASVQRFVKHVKGASATQQSQEDVDSVLKEINGPVARRYLTRSFLVAAAAAIGSSLDRDEQVKVSCKLLEISVDINQCVGDIGSLPGGVHLCDVTVDVCSGEYIPFSSLLRPPAFEDLNPARVGDPDVIIPTATTLRNSLTLASLIDASCGSMLLLVGPPGCGKSMVVGDALSSMPNVDLAAMSFSSTTSPADILATLRAHAAIQKLPNGDLCLRPITPGSKIVLFCDEVNLGSPDLYGTQTAACFLRQLLEHQGFWGTDSGTWVRVEGLQIVAACNPPELSGRQKLPSRLMRHSHVMRVLAPCADDLLTIFGVLNRSLLHSVDPSFGDNASGLTLAMVQVYEANLNKFSPPSSGPLQPHYVYSPRDLSRWLRGMRHILLEGDVADGTCDIRDDRDARGHISFSPMSAENEDVNNLVSAKSTSWGDVLSALVHEARRLFVDRLMTCAERQFAEKVLLSALTDHLGFSKSTLRDQWYSAWPKRHHRRHGASATPHSSAYQPVRDLSSLRKVVYRKLRAFCEEEGLGGAWMSGSGANEGSSSMIDQFAVTDDVLRHLTRIERVLRLPLGHAVLVGAPGSGKKTLARFAAWMGGISVHQVRSHAGYTAENFASDLRSVLHLAGVSGSRVMMIFDESNALKGEFLEMMNAILACGDVPGLFEGESRVALLSSLRKQDLGMATSSTDEALYKKFVQRVRVNLHVVFTLSCDSKAARIGSGEGAVPIAAQLLSRSPALYNRCMVDWMGDWDESTLEAVADLKLEVMRGSEKEAFVKAACQIHDCAGKVLANCPGAARFATPRHYLEFVEQVNRITLEKAREVQSKASRLKTGLSALHSASLKIDDLKQSLGAKTEKLVSKELEANETLASMAEEQRLAEKAKVDAEALAIQAEHAADAAVARKDEVAGLLAAVEPKIEAARNAVGSIRKENLEELRAMPNPPAGARLALQAVIMLLDTASTGRPAAPLAWQALRSRLRGTELIRSVLKFEPDSVPSELVTRLRGDILSNEAFDVGRISYSSRAAGPMAEWTLASLEYAEVNESIAPLRQEAQDLEREREEYVLRKEEADSSVVELRERIEQCRLQYAALISEAESVRREIAKSEKKLDMAEEMVDSLASEWDRWMSDLSFYNESAEYVWGNAVLGAAFVAYAGALDEDSRKRFLVQCRKILNKTGVECQARLSIGEYLSTAQERSSWIQGGLPMDETSVESYAIMKRSARYPLIVDPSRRMDHVVRAIVLSSRPPDILHASGRSHPSHGPEKSIVTKTSFASTGKQSYLRVIESAMRFGTAVLVEDAEQFDHSIAPVLGQEATTGDVGDLSSVDSGATGDAASAPSGLSHRLVRLGDRDVDQNPSFRLFMMAADLSATPAAAVSRACVVSFTFSAANIRSRCLSSTLRCVSPSLEVKRAELTATRAGNEQRKLALEDDLLGAIADAGSGGDGLLEGTLLPTLQKLKAEASEISSSIESHEKLIEEVQDVAAEYEAVASFAVDIFFLLQKLQALNELYKFNADFYLSLFEKCVKGVYSREDSGESGKSLIQHIRNDLFSSIFLATAPSLFPEDQIPFAASLALVSCGDGNSQAKIESSLREVLLVGEPHVTCASQAKSPEVDGRPVPDVVSVLANVCKAHPVYAAGILQEIAGHIPGADASIIHRPSARSDHALREVLQSYAGGHRENNGARESGGYDRQSRVQPLLLCVRGSGVDPAGLVSAYCSEAALVCESVAVGDAESLPIARSALEYAAQRWGRGRSSRTKAGVLLIKNLHLAPSGCLEFIRREILKMHGTLVYQLILVCEVGEEHIPFSILNLGAECRVLAFEAPCDFRSTLGRSISVAQCGSASQEVVNCFLPVIAWMHATIVERCRYAPTGISKWYDFGESDLEAACSTVRSLFGGLPVRCKSALVGILIDSIYGARVGSSNDAIIVAKLIRDVIAVVDPATSVAKTQFSYGGQCIALSADPSELAKTLETLPATAPAAWIGLDPAAELDLKARTGLTRARRLARLYMYES